MTDRKPTPPRRTTRAATAEAQRLGALAALALLVAACGSMGGVGGATAPAAPLTPVAAPVPAGPDSLAAFAASAVPGQEGTVVENGVASRARLARVYHAASGRECREVLFGSGPSQRARLACRGEDGVFAEARPLLRGGGGR